MSNNGFVLVVSAPSGCGKDTIIQKVLQKMNGEAVLSVSMTTRDMREGEKEGVNYYYVSKDEFFRHIADGDMLEYTNYGSNYYGTPIKPVKNQLAEGKIVILIIEVEGGENVKKAFPDAKKIFVIPPSMKILEERLRSRGTDSDEAISKRLTIAECELKRACEYDYIVENDDLDEAVEDVLAIIKAEQLKINNMKNKLKEVMNYA